MRDFNYSKMKKKKYWSPAEGTPLIINRALVYGKKHPSTVTQAKKWMQGSSGKKFMSRLKAKDKAELKRLLK